MNPFDLITCHNASNVITRSRACEVVQDNLDLAMTSGGLVILTGVALLAVFKLLF